MTDLPHRQRPRRLCLSCTQHPAALAFPLVYKHTMHSSPCVLPVYHSFQSCQPHRETIGLFTFSDVIYFVFSWRVISLSHHSITYAARPWLWVISPRQDCPSQGQMRGSGWGRRRGWQCEHKQNCLYLPSAASAAPEGHDVNSLAQIRVKAKIIKGDACDV